MDSRPTDIGHEELWEFPIAAYPLKVMGRADAPMAEIVARIIQRHIPGFDPATLELQKSSKGTWVSVRASFPVDNKTQINGLYADLAAEPAIRMAL